MKLNKIASVFSALLMTACFTESPQPEESTQTCRVSTSKTQATAGSGLITVPKNWPSQEMQMGLVWSQVYDQEAIDEHVDELSQFYKYRYFDLTWMTEATALNAIREMIQSPDTVMSHPGVIFNVMEASTLSGQERVDDLLTKMNDSTHVASFFNHLKSLADILSQKPNAHPTIILNPQLWNTLVQAQVHFPDLIHTPLVDLGRSEAQSQYKYLLDFPAKVNYDELLGVDPVFEPILQNYPSTVKGLARAMVAAAKSVVSQANISIGVDYAALNTVACGSQGSHSPNGLALADGTLDSQGAYNLVTQSQSDIEQTSLAFVQFFRELYGWGNEYHEDNWPDMFSVERGGLDAGLVNHGPDQTTSSGPAYHQDKVGAGTDVFFWDQIKMDKWVSWAKMLSHGTQTPLLALNIPLGNGLNTANEVFDYQDTFMDWLHGDGSPGNWAQQTLPSTGVTPYWDADNFQDFKQAGFVGLFVGAVGWPAVGTHYGAKSQSIGTGGPSGSMTGDQGFAINSFEAQDRSLSPISVDFDENKLSVFLGICGTPGQGDTTLVDTTLLDSSDLQDSIPDVGDIDPAECDEEIPLDDLEDIFDD